MNSDAVFAVARHVAVEYFDSGALLLDLRSRKPIELGARQARILDYLDGRRSLAQVAEWYSQAFALPHEEAAETVQETCEILLAAHCLQLERGSWNGDVMDAIRYIQNLDVNLREEDDDGALLFNPDTDRVQLLNGTGLYIWKLCAEGRSEDEIVAAFRQDFDAVPEDEIKADIEEFINRMLDGGFIGKLETL